MFAQIISSGCRSWAWMAGLTFTLALRPEANAAWPDPPYPDLTTDEAFIEDISHRAFLFFKERSDNGDYHSNPKINGTGLTQDRSERNGSDNNFASIAATGWYLTSLPIAVERGWMSHDEAEWRATNCLAFLAGTRSDGRAMPHTHGFFRHFIDKQTGTNLNSEVSTIDMAICVLGALTAGQYFGGDALRQANTIFERIEWNWMRTRGGSNPTNGSVCMAWNKNEFSRSEYHWSEAVSLYLLALGTPIATNRLPNASWSANRCEKFPTYNVPGYGTLKVYDATPIFIPQQPHNWFPLENRVDSLGQNYWQNALNSTLVHRQYCIDHRDPDGIAPKYLTYNTNFWGINASDGPRGYRAWSAPDNSNNGTITPTGAIAASPFCKGLADNYAIRAGRAMYDAWRQQLFGRYGFGNAYNVNSNWFDADVIGIDLGMLLCNLENARSGLIWRILSGHPFMYRAYSAAQLHPVCTVGTTYVIEPTHAPGMVLTADGGGTTNATHAVLHKTATVSDSNYWAAQRWTLQTADSANYFRLVNIKSGRSLEIPSTSADVVAHNSENQHWRFVPAGNGAYVLANRTSNEFLDVKGGGTTNGTPVQQRSSPSAEPTQIWKFYESPIAATGAGEMKQPQWPRAAQRQ